MATTERQIHDLWMHRITETIGLLEGSLTTSESRGETEIKQAVQVFRDWAETQHSEDKFLAFTLAWTRYSGLCFGLVYREGDDLYSFSDIPYEATPPWEEEESLLIAGLALALRARELLQVQTRKAYAAAAMMYANAKEALYLWDDLRGTTKSREPHEASVRLAKDMNAKRRRDVKVALASENARRKQATSPAGKHKPAVKKMWLDWKKNQATYRSGAAFDRAAVDKYPEITSTVTISRWRREWSITK